MLKLISKFLCSFGLSDGLNSLNCRILTREIIVAFSSLLSLSHGAALWLLSTKVLDNGLMRIELI